jgi:hypothetical protein
MLSEMYMEKEVETEGETDIEGDKINHAVGEFEERRQDMDRPRRSSMDSMDLEDIMLGKGSAERMMGLGLDSSVFSAASDMKARSDDIGRIPDRAPSTAPHSLDRLVGVFPAGSPRCGTANSTSPTQKSLSPSSSSFPSPKQKPSPLFMTLLTQPASPPPPSAPTATEHSPWGVLTRVERVRGKSPKRSALVLKAPGQGTLLESMNRTKVR